MEHIEYKPSQLCKSMLSDKDLSKCTRMFQLLQLEIQQKDINLEVFTESLYSEMKKELKPEKFNVDVYGKHLLLYLEQANLVRRFETYLSGIL